MSVARDERRQAVATRATDQTSTGAASRADILDVLRGMAVVAVMLLHCGILGVGRSTTWYDEWVWPVLQHGYLGVQLFFVISGYCIQGAVESALRSPTPLRSFVRRRVRRIYPPYWWSLIVSIALAAGTIVLMKKSWWSVFPLSARDWVLNALLLQGPFGVPDAGIVYWSLSIEVQFYMVMAVCLLLGRWSAAWFLALSAGYVAWVSHPSLPIAGTVLAYWPEFACGIAAYCAGHYGVVGRKVAAGLWLLTALSAGIGVMQGQAVLADSGELTTPYKQIFCLFCGIVLSQAIQHNRNGRPLPFTGGLAQLGLMSYSLYLTHVQIGTRVFNLADRLLDLNGPLWIPVCLLSLVIQFVAGAVFYRYCEVPWLNRREAAVVDQAPLATANLSAALPTEAVV